MSLKKLLNDCIDIKWLLLIAFVVGVYMIMKPLSEEDCNCGPTH